MVVPFGIFASFVLFCIVTAMLFLSGLLGLAGKHAARCVQYETKFVQYNTIRTLGSLTINEPVWKEDCKYDVTLPTPEPSDQATPLN